MLDRGASVGQSARVSEEQIDRVKLMPEYGCLVPLWAGGNLDVDECRQLGMPSQLIERLVTWQADFEANFDAELAWSRNPAAREPWRATGEELAADLRRELPGIAVTVDLWPVDSRT